ncbi:TB2/DP1/HVA22-related protein [Carpediemonas membranifera]|uniref:TB2/DP1/HVA22-related protein n=1 Tax=Carpediemonas membranifera TaxID=201153 RepID=A0A8J6B2J8_9EUKA|nr:TB2/DP1/HVA22-related protein [Carpediemonas membranifera]|eukprot:KAG9391544.1 TB2/DP1/HVA22-related protein [Carpediemonas membranifera]
MVSLRLIGFGGWRWEEKKRRSQEMSEGDIHKAAAGFWLSRPLVNIIQFTYPAYASFKALQTDEPDDDQQWLSYWIIVGIFNILEFFLDIIMRFLPVPFYYEFKILFLLWAQLPFTKGAFHLYKTIVEPWLRKYEGSIDEALASAGYKGKVLIKKGLHELLARGQKLTATQSQPGVQFQGLDEITESEKDQ